MCSNRHINKLPDVRAVWMLKIFYFGRHLCSCRDCETKYLKRKGLGSIENRVPETWYNQNLCGSSVTTSFLSLTCQPGGHSAAYMMEWKMLRCSMVHCHAYKLTTFHKDSTWKPCVKANGPSESSAEQEFALEVN